jgi:glutaminyl-peptide cyclotransferase
MKIFTKKSIFYTLMILFPCLAIANFSPLKSDSDQLIEHVQQQLSFGSRVPGSEASKKAAEYFKTYLESNNWQVEFQEFKFDGITLHNVIAKNSSTPPHLIIGTHYDTRQLSDQDPDKTKQSLPVPGAIDGASGSAIILQLSKYILKNEQSIWLVFFDGEDQGNINNWQWSIGAEYFAKKLIDNPKYVVILDMLGDSDLKVYKEKNSSLGLSVDIWAIAKELGYKNNFIDKLKYSMMDDHQPFINKGIPTALLIDFDYPFWHTTSDTLDKVSKQNLNIVFEVMLKWINSLNKLKYKNPGYFRGFCVGR